VTGQVGGDDCDSNNNNRNDASQQQDQRQEIEKEESSDLKELSGMSMVEHRMPKKRKRCGKCTGCTTLGNCGQCPPCNSTRTHQVCRQRRCSNLLRETALGVSSPGMKRSHINVQVGVDPWLVWTGSHCSELSEKSATSKKAHL
jgi:hypothetical protein